MRNLFKITLVFAIISILFALFALTELGQNSLAYVLNIPNKESLIPYFYLSGILSLICGLIFLLVAITLKSSGIDVTQKLSKDLTAYTEGNDIDTENLPTGLLGNLILAIKKLIGVIKNAEFLLENISDSEKVKNLFGKDKISQAIKKMQENLQQIKQEEQVRSKSLTFQGRINEIIQENQSDIWELGKNTLSTMAKEYSIQKGKMYYLKQTEDNTEPIIETIAAYADFFDKEKPNQISLGEGLVGQAIKDNQFTFSDNVPENYDSVNSGLGTSKPKTLAIIPIHRNQVCYGAFEVLSLHSLEPHEIETLKNIGETLGTTFMAWRNKEENDKLFQASQELAISLKEKETELLKQQGFLKKAQDMLKDKLVVLEDETSYSKSIIEAIDRSNAAISLSPDAIILEANNMFCSVMGFTPEELKKQPEAIILPEDERNSTRHKLMWESLKTGASFTGDFKRLARSGNEVWLNGSYNPIFNAKGEIVKIILFAQFTTEQKEAELEHKAKIKGYEKSVMALTFKTDGSIISTNELFSESTGLKRLQLKRYNFGRMLQGLEKEAEEVFNTVIKTQEQAEFNAILNLKNIEPIEVVALLQPIPSIDGKTSKVLVTLKVQKPISVLSND
ncbi:MAG: PAS domain S-box protein [Luteibaculaceae bacterium]